TQDEVKEFDSDIKDLKELRVELYYMCSDKLYRIRNDKTIEIHSFEFITNQNRYVIKEPIALSRSFIKNHFFYSIAVNYSLYGLNTKEAGLWLKPLFHKNDAYQTPLVLNPMRTEGIIDINRVTYLSKSRLLANILRSVPKHTKLEDSLR